MRKYVLAFLIGTATGLRSMTAPAALAARRGRLRLRDGPPDLPIALPEDALAVAGSISIVSLLA